MLTNKTPDVVNQLLKDNNGFDTGGGDFIWSKSSILGLNQIFVSYRWSDLVTDAGIQQAKDYLDKGNALLCEIDFNPATTGEEMHFVVCVGYDDNGFYIYDPWDGTIKSFDAYGGFQRAVIQFHVYDLTFPKVDTTVMVPVESSVFENLVRKSTIYDAIFTKLNVQDSQTIVLAEIDKLISYEDAVGKKDQQIAEAQATISSLQKTASDKETELKTLQDDVTTLTERVNAAVDQNKTLQKQLADAQQAAQQPILTGWKLSVYKWLIGKK